MTMTTFWRTAYGTGLVLFLFAIVFPFYWIFVTSLKAPEAIYSYPPQVIPLQPTLANYENVFTGLPFATYLKNSFIVSTITTLVTVISGALAAYSVARVLVNQRAKVMFIFLLVSMFPGIIIISPLFRAFMALDLLNSYAALVIPNAALTLPLTLWILTAFFLQLPLELEEAARVDGCSRLQALWKVVVPLAAPGVFTAAILAFIATWNDFLFALIFNTRDEYRTATVGLALFPGQYTYPWGDVTAATVVVTLPLLLMVLLLQRWIIAGLTAGAVKA
jgi:multiple sugar transport system permease protein